MDIKFCMFCGKEMRMLYPGNNPENGPAEMRCLDSSHLNARDLAHQEYTHEIMDCIIHDLAGHFDPYCDYPKKVQEAAEVIIKHSNLW